MFNNKIIFISGGTGSWGNELVRQLLSKHKPKEVRIYSRGEHRQVQMKQEFKNHPTLRFIIGDVRDKNILNLHLKGVDYVFHLAALKHVPVCEENCWEAVLTNIYGTQNIIECAIANNVKKVVDISTDKAVDPFNLYGVTKACGEKMIINANQNYISNTKFICIRGGNVLGTNGSVIPLFKRQIQERNEVTITDSSMTRYFMSTQEAISLIFKAFDDSIGGEIFVMRMPAARLEYVVSGMIKVFGNSKTKKRTIGVRPGEKKHEVLVSKNESPRTKIYNPQYYVILPQYPCPEIEAKYASLKPIEYDEYSSQNAPQLSESSFIAMLKKGKADLI